MLFKKEETEIFLSLLNPILIDLKNNKLASESHKNIFENLIIDLKYEPENFTKRQTEILISKLQNYYTIPILDKLKIYYQQPDIQIFKNILSKTDPIFSDIKYFKMLDKLTKTKNHLDIFERSVNLVFLKDNDPIKYYYSKIELENSPNGNIYKI